MQILLKIPGHKTLTFSTPMLYYSQALEQQIHDFIESRLGIPSQNYSLFSRLKNNRKIQNNSEIKVNFKLRGGFNLYIKNLKLECHKVDVDGYDTIASLKLKVMAKFNVPPQFMRIIFAGKQLEDDRTIYDYNISKETTLHMIMKVYDNKLD